MNAKENEEGYRACLLPSLVLHALPVYHGRAIKNAVYFFSREYLSVLTRKPHREWYAEVKRLKLDLESAPGNLELAGQFWAAISGKPGYDVRDGYRAITTFRASAITSDQGLGELLTAFRQLAKETGESPNAALFDPPLENRLRSVTCQAGHPLADDANWILEFINAGD